MAELDELVARLSLTDRDVTRLANAFYAAKASQYRTTLLELSGRFGHLRRRVLLSEDIRVALREEANQHAAQVVDTMNGYLRGEAERLAERPGTAEQKRAHLEAYMGARAAARSGMIARNEVATAKLDATLSFYRENGLEPEVHFVGPRPKCAVCVELMESGPHPIAKALAVGLPHINCRHTWKVKGVRRGQLRGGGLRPGQISAGRGATGGIVGGEPLVNRAGNHEAAAALLRTL